jgi:5'-nucleotidase
MDSNEQTERGHVFVDIDGVVADFGSGLECVARKDWAGYKHPWHAPGFYRGLYPMPGALDAVRRLKTNFHVYFLSTGSASNAACFTEKIEWIAEHFGPDMIDNVILTARKDLIAVPGGVPFYLVDDRLTNGAANFQGNFIHFGSEQFPNWESVLTHLGS